MTMPNGEDEKNLNQWTVRDVLVAMSGKGYPNYILKFITDVQTWMEDILSGEEMTENEKDILMPYLEEPFEVDMDNLFSRIEWAEQCADVIPSLHKPTGHDDAIVLALGPAQFEDGVRMAIDYASLFGRDVCQRVWLMSDSYMISDLLRYSAHIRTLFNQGIVFRFIMITPWGWTEIPVGDATRPGGRLNWRNLRKGSQETSNGNSSSGDDDRAH
ncbi:MAG: hypothetical protein WCQ97_10030 [Aminobacterium sp.]|jgi:hypothetical protein|uniref:hypothetical protein n=1 Tax=Aminobacterium sp. MB27-C1 TaxID=3070661 RepID=UPI001BCFF0F4|nr:hypothetical protein [Aminobacterium sp. MB27-C1]MDD2206094.1 hypothetical protein [Aminobacterium sp.]MDD3707813.1 hypothetical protein [Aminobacterium sp.]MDD4228062.1 hypothetical protein [Aminobacterium sp.]MDD4551091.1 hypothetical protein [Aminobacterium sp.]WMI72111.1 hypothetical protein RBH88_03145 [Aminobacterium sp. MB27-C1]